MTAALPVLRVFEDSGGVMMDRIKSTGGDITQSSLTSLTLAIYEYDNETDARNAANGTVVTGQGGTLTVSSHVYDTLQTSFPWTKDTTGYNFRYDNPAANIPTGGKWYRFEFKFTPTSGSVFHTVWLVDAQPLATS